MKNLGLFNGCVLVIWLGLLLFVAMAHQRDGDLVFLCLSVVVGLPVLAGVNVIWLIGLAVDGRSRETAKLAGQKRPSSTMDARLTTYLRKVKASGVDDVEIEHRLRMSGWSDEKIQWARRTLDS